MEKQFKDLFNREIKIGDTVLNVWANTESYNAKGDGDPGAVQYRIAQVFKFTEKGIRIEFLRDGKLIKSSVYNTHNRIIIMSKDNELTVSFEYEENMTKKRLKARDLEIKELNKDLLLTTQLLNRRESIIRKKETEIKTLTKTIENLERVFTRDYQRFTLLDL